MTTIHTLIYFILHQFITLFLYSNNNNFKCILYLQSSIECFYDEPGGIVYLHLTGTFDSYSITQNIDELSTEIEEKVRNELLLFLEISK